MVDAHNFLKDFSSAEYLSSRNLTETDEDSRTIVNLLTDQVEFANVIILNKIDLIAEDQLKELYAILTKLNGSARILPAKDANVPLNEVINTGLFDYEKAEASAGWINELENEHTPETEEYGISSFVFRSQRPFHPERFLKYINSSFPSNVIRSKGLFWLASRLDQALVWSSAGGSCKADYAGIWWASMPFQERINYASFVENQQHIEAAWHPKFGDRKTELVIIGQYLDKSKIISQLESCLLTDRETGLWGEGKLQMIDNWPLQD